jgi:hypothetical protein
VKALGWFSVLFFVSSWARASVDHAVIYDGTDVPTIEAQLNNEGKVEVVDHDKPVDFGQIKTKQTKIKFVKFKNKTDRTIACRGASFSGEGFSYSMNSLELEPGETTAIQVSFYASPTASAGSKKGHVGLLYGPGELGSKDVLNLKMKAKIAK